MAVPYTTPEKRRAHDGSPEFLERRRITRLKAKGLDETSPKLCVACNKEQPLSEFHRHSQNGGVRPRCKACRSAEAKNGYDPEYHRAHHLLHREERLAKMREYRAQNLEWMREQNRQYQRDNRITLKSKTLVRKYGITLEQWHKIFAAQGKVCRICRSPEPKNKRGWHTDHGVTVRGILCHHCNTGLGAFNHDIGCLKAAIRYLTK